MVTIHQPDFLPWLGFFDRWRQSDLYIVLDDVQFLKRGWHHRDKIKTREGAAWLTVPVRKKGRYHQLIKAVEIDNASNWQVDHLNCLAASYRRAPNYNICIAGLEEIYGRNHCFLIDLNLDLLDWVAAKLGIDTPRIYSSDCPTRTTASQRIVELVKQVNGKRYLTGQGSRSYLEEGLFDGEGIEIVWQNFETPVYRQLHGPFLPMLSCLDYLMMHPTEE